MSIAKKFLKALSGILSIRVEIEVKRKRSAIENQQ
jgi:hypothetical protein